MRGPTGGLESGWSLGQRGSLGGTARGLVGLQDSVMNFPREGTHYAGGWDDGVRAGGGILRGMLMEESIRFAILGACALTECESEPATSQRIVSSGLVGS